MAKKIAIINNKGGVAKTTTATNLASILANDSNNRVLLVDGDAQGNTLVSYGRNPYTHKDTLYDVLIGGIPAASVIDNVRPRLHILPSNDDLDYLDQDVWTNQVYYPAPFSLLKKALKDTMEPFYTHIIFDASPGMHLINMNILAYTDAVIIPFELEETALKGIVRVVNKIEDFRHKVNADLSVEALLPVKVEARTNLHQDIIEEVQQYATEEDLFLFRPGIPKTIKFAESVTRKHRPAAELSLYNKATEQYKVFTQTLKDKDVV